MPSGFSGGDTAFVLISAALVMLMTPGLAFFYGGMVRAKSALNMLVMSFIALGIVTVLWVLFGFSLSFGPDAFHGLIGNLHYLGMRNIGMNKLYLGYGIPIFALSAFQLMFAVITPALISGAIADRTRFAAWGLFVALWTTLVYFPVAHWVFYSDNGKGGWLVDHVGVARLRRRHGGAPQRRCGRSRPVPGARQAGRLQEGPDASAQPAAGDARLRSAVVRLVRLQRRLRALRQRPGRRGLHEHPDRHCAPR